MILLGLLLLLATGAFAGLLIAYNTSGGPEYTVTMFDNDVATMNSLSIFLAGLALALLFCLGVAMIMAGSARRRHRSVARRDTRAPVETAERDAVRDRPAEGQAPADQARTGSPRHKFRHHFGH
ncbi:hypothetical protein ACQEVG_16975 [Streptomyces sp. CA-135486]|uniref:hypothetical protein n=1 Tax=Streptomyces sp. CA-135486 TaxID=3240049 RepID=UPI003D8C57DD